MNVEIETEAAHFPEKENLNGIFLAVHPQFYMCKKDTLFLCKVHAKKCTLRHFAICTIPVV
jgi:hypothetical protein